MTEAQFSHLIAAVRARVDAALRTLDRIDSSALDPRLRDQYERIRRGWEALHLMTHGEGFELYAAACERAGRDLAPDEVRALLGLLPPQ